MRFRAIRGAVALAALLGSVVVLGPAPAQAGTGSLRLLARTPWVGEGIDYGLALEAASAPSGAQLRLVVHDRVRSRSEFARSVDGAGLRARVYDPGSFPLTSLDADGDGVLNIAVPLVAREGVQPASIPRQGVYPVEIQLLDAGGASLDTLVTHLVRLPPLDPASAAVPLEVAVVVPLHAAPAHLDTAGPAAPDLPLATVTEALADHPGVAVTLAPTPESLAAAAVADAAAVTALGDAVRASGSEVLAAPWVDLDDAAWDRADDDELDRQLTAGGTTLVRLLATTPAATRLVRVDLGQQTVAAMVEHDARAVIVPQASLEPLDDRDFPYTLARPFRLALDDRDDSDGSDDNDGRDERGRSTVQALASDTGLGAFAELAQDDPVLAASLVLADLAVIAADEPASTRVATLVLPARAVRSARFLAALLAGLEPPSPPIAPASTDPTAPTPPATPAAAPLVVARTVTAALESVVPAGADGGADADDPLVRAFDETVRPESVTGLANRIASARGELASFRGVFGAGDVLAAQTDDVLGTAAAIDLEGTARAAALESVESTLGGQLAGLHAPARQRVTLTAREGRIQLVLTNDTGRPASVDLVLRGDRLVLPDAPDGHLPVQLTGATTRVDLRVEARSSGDAPLLIRITSPDGRLALGESRITVRTTAVSGVGVLLMGAAAAFLTAWWTRTILRERRSTRGRHPAHVRS